MPRVAGAPLLELLLGLTVESAVGGALALRHAASGFAFEVRPATPPTDGSAGDPDAVDFDPVDFGKAVLPEDFQDCLELEKREMPAFFAALHSHLVRTGRS
jgi:hypothetical protein